ncbi:MAG: hypothetical protein ACI9DJ_002366 [Algoriphagus sp.]|jgi:uncharacterized protein
MKTKFEDISRKVLEVLSQKLPVHLTYHSIEHTKYVVKMAEYLAWRENMGDHDKFLIKVAALYHDIGFIKSRENHESIGCEIACEELPKEGIEPDDITKKCGMIMATKIPQKPQNLREEILVDADLEYLSTQNFEPVSDMLFKELKHFNPAFTRKDWRSVQIGFLSKYSYRTSFCKMYKESFKEQHLLKLKGLDLRSLQGKDDVQKLVEIPR